MAERRPIAERAKRWYDPGDGFVALAWTEKQRQQDPDRYRSQLLRHHFRYLQHIGTSFGQFLGDLKSIWVARLVSTVSRGLETSQTPLLPLEEWIEAETDQELRGELEACLLLYEDCHVLTTLALQGAGNERFSQFMPRYRRVFGIEGGTDERDWLNRADVPLGGGFGGRAVMEAAARVPALLAERDAKAKETNETREEKEGEGEEGDPQGGEGPELDAEDRKLLFRFAGIWGVPFWSVRDWLPGDDREAYTIFLVLCDLALMPTVGRYHDPTEPTPSLADLLPGLRLLKAAWGVRRLGLNLRDLEADYERFVTTLCRDREVAWNTPRELAARADTASPPPELPGVVLDLQRRAMTLRQERAWAFASRSPPREKSFRIPLVFLGDRTETSGRKKEREALMGAFFERIGAQIWLSGVPPGEEYRLIPDFKKRVSETFERLFGVGIQEMLEKKRA